MTIAERLSPRHAISFAGRDWRVLFTNELLLRLEQATNEDILTKGLNLRTPSALTLRTIVHEVLLHAGAECSPKDVGKLLSIGRIMEIRLTLFEAWQSSMPDPEKRRGKGQQKQVKYERLTWINAWARARLNLGISDQEWLELTPRLVHEMLREWMENRRELEVMFGLVIAHSTFYSGNYKGELPDPKSYMLHPWDDSEGNVTVGEIAMREFSKLRKVH